jgi:hypothetical protein
MVTNLEGSTKDKKFLHQPSEYYLPKKGFLLAGITRNTQPYKIFTSYFTIPTFRHTGRAGFYTHYWCNKELSDSTPGVVNFFYLGGRIRLFPRGCNPEKVARNMRVSQFVIHITEQQWVKNTTLHTPKCVIVVSHRVVGVEKESNSLT